MPRAPFIYILRLSGARYRDDQRCSQPLGAPFLSWLARATPENDMPETVVIFAPAIGAQSIHYKTIEFKHGIKDIFIKTCAFDAAQRHQNYQWANGGRISALKRFP